MITCCWAGEGASCRRPGPGWGAAPQPAGPLPAAGPHAQLTWTVLEALAPPEVTRIWATPAENPPGCSGSPWRYRRWSSHCRWSRSSSVKLTLVPLATATPYASVTLADDGDRRAGASRDRRANGEVDASGHAANEGTITRVCVRGVPAVANVVVGKRIRVTWGPVDLTVNGLYGTGAQL